MMRARYGTGVFLKLNKRECDIRIRLTPCDIAVLRVHWRLCGDNLYFYPNGDCGGQFSSFLTALYCLYTEENDDHMWIKRWNKDFVHEYPPIGEKSMHTLKTFVKWECEQFGWAQIQFTRNCENTRPTKEGHADPIHIEIKDGLSVYNYTVDGRDLCYAVARGCTEAIKKYGLRGYRQFTGGNYEGDSFDLDELLFVKAYALGCIDVRCTKELWEIPGSWMRAEHSAFEKELELLLFDM